MASYSHIIILWLYICNLISLSGQTSDCDIAGKNRILCNIESLTNGNLTINTDVEATKTLEVVCKSKEIAKIFPSANFIHLQNLEHLIIKNCSFLQIEQSALKGLKNLTILVIQGNSNKNRTHINENLFESTPKLHNIRIKMKIDQMPRRLLCNLHHLTILTLRGNFQYLDAIGCGENNTCCSQLNGLFFQNNKVKKIEGKDLELPYLQMLNLNFNGITEIKPGAFDNLQNLTTLFINHNKLVEINGNLLENTRILEILDLSFNKLRYLPKKIFQNLKTLKFLELNNNHLIFNQTSKDIFKTLHSLQEIDLSFNQIEYLPPGIFSGLTKLQNLLMNNNLLNQISDNDFLFLKVLQTLRINNNNVTKISKDAFKTLIELRQLKLSNNKLQNIPDLQKLKKLTKLSLGHNSITNIEPDCFLNSVQLRFLGLEDNKIQILRNSTFHTALNLTTIKLSRNDISFIEDGTFEVLKNLSNLYLAGNKITEMKSLFVTVKNNLTLNDNQIQEFEFTSIGDELKTINLDHNQLHKIQNPFFSSNDKLQHFSANNNQLEICSVSSFPESIKTIKMSNNSITKIDKFTIKVLPDLELVELKYNLISEISDNDFAFTNAQRELLYTVPVVDLGYNVLICSCKNNWMIKGNKFYPSVVLEEDQLCNVTYTRMKKYVTHLKILTIQKNQMMCENVETCLSQCRCFFNDELSIMDCFNVTWKQPTTILHENFTTIFFDGNTNIGSVVSRLLINSPILQTLYLNNSGLLIISKDMFQGVGGLKELYLEENQLEYISPDVFMNLPKLKILSLRKNKLQQPQFWIMALPHLSEITFSENNFVCDCEFVTSFQKWVTKHQKIKFHDLNVTYCEDSSVPIIYFNDSSCYEMINKEIQMVLIIAPTVSIFTFLIIFLIFLYLYRVEVKVWLYSKYGVRMFYNNDKDADVGKVYSAFISYASEDEQWMVENLLPQLEDYKLCIHNRDFPVGEFISDSIMSAVKNSCRTVILLSRHFLKSRWCQFEFDTAHLQSMQDKCKRLVVVRLEKMDESEIDKNVSAYLKTNTYLDINDAFFWDKLKYALPDLETVQE
uniref:TIR domain-containing protein n=1 Tax=Strigamia maritima TaxID=126957 RepID=T1IVY8_STRMM